MPPFSVSRTIFFSNTSTNPKSDPQKTFKKKKKIPKNTSKTPQNWAGGAVTGYIVQHIAQ